MMEAREFLKGQVKNMLAWVEREQSAGELKRQLEHADEEVRAVDKKVFVKEWSMLQLALASTLWRLCCDQYDIRDEESGKLFLREVMKRYDAATQVQEAACFSDYICAPNVDSEGSLILSMSQKLFDRLGLESGKQEGDQTVQIKESFKILLYKLEGFRSAFEQRFASFF
ncbi:MAG: hypothetical protein JW893_04095 [Candidatus Omnitrophica bacterium]|nr:hypothetical protein [Candidatus Omnitrophota bacterium]